MLRSGYGGLFPPAPTLAAMERYQRQIRFAGIGEDGQRRLRAARVAVVGCGALGTVAAEQLARAGVGALRLVDRDVVEPSNLHRQALFDEADAREARPKALAAAERLAALNDEVALEPVPAHLGPANVRELLEGCALVVDGSDNFGTRHLVNEACCERGIPWIYGACVGAYGCSMAVIPDRTPCLRCIQSELPHPGDGPTCESAGVIAPVVHLVAAWQVGEALKLLCGREEAVRRELWSCDLWANAMQRLRLAGWRDPACAACGPHASRPALNAGDEPAIVLCGREAVHVARPGRPELAAFAARLGDRCETANRHVVRWRDGDLRGTVFADGRVIVQGTPDADRARAFCDRWLG